MLQGKRAACHLASRASVALRSGMSADTLCWTDIPVTDLDRAINFYSAVLGKKVSKESAEGVEYGLLPHEEQNSAGCLVEADDNKPSRTGPLIYLSVEGRLDDAVTKVRASGGQILQEKHSIGPHGFRAIILDSEGNRIALHSS
jgi:predicted enzyme related to lactoylglutathione lyase